MKIRRRRKLPWWTLAILALVLLISGAGYLYYINRQHAGTPSTTETPESTADDEPAEQTNQESSDPNVANSPVADASSDRDILTTPKPDLSLAITAIKQQSENLVVSTDIKPLSTGTCTLELTRPGHERVVTESRLVKVTSRSSQCENLTAPTSRLADGEWIVTVKIHTDNGVATATRPFEVR